MRYQRTRLSVGTGVLYERNGCYYIATAWHNLTGRHSETLKPVSLSSAVPDNVIATIAIKNPAVGEFPAMCTRMSFTLPIEDDTGALYWVHPQGWPRIDVAVLPINPDKDYDSEMAPSTGEDVILRLRMRNPVFSIAEKTDIQTIQECSGTYGTLGCNPDDLIDPGDDLFILGYPRAIADYTMSPIWKRASVASNPRYGWNKQAAFLVDCASREGMSGAPVIAYSKIGTIEVPGGIVFGDGPSTALHGIYVGRMIDAETPQEDRLFEASIGTVWKRSVIDEIIDARHMGTHSSEMQASSDEIEAAIRSLWPKVVDDQPIIKFSEYGERFIVHNVLVQLKGRSSPQEVRDAVNEHAAGIGKVALAPAPELDRS